MPFILEVTPKNLKHVHAPNFKKGERKGYFLNSYLNMFTALHIPGGIYCLSMYVWGQYPEKLQIFLNVKKVAHDFIYLFTKQMG